jgi:hypothetical protein
MGIGSTAFVGSIAIREELGESPLINARRRDYRPRKRGRPVLPMNCSFDPVAGVAWRQSLDDPPATVVLTVIPIVIGFGQTLASPDCGTASSADHSCHQ